MSDVVSIKTPVQQHHVINYPQKKKKEKKKVDCFKSIWCFVGPAAFGGKQDDHRSRANTWLEVWSPDTPAVCLNKLIWKKKKAMHALPLTDHLSHHEEEADATGNEKLPSGQTSGVTVDLRHWSRHLAELLVLPQTDKAGHIFAPLWWRVWTFLLCCSQPKLREKCHNCQKVFDITETWNLTSLKCRDYPQSGVVSRTLLKTPSVSPSQFNSCARESRHLLQTSVIWPRGNKSAANGSSLAASLGQSDKNLH